MSLFGIPLGPEVGYGLFIGITLAGVAHLIESLVGRARRQEII